MWWCVPISARRRREKNDSAWFVQAFVASAQRRRQIMSEQDAFAEWHASIPQPNPNSEHAPLIDSSMEHIGSNKCSAESAELIIALRFAVILLEQQRDEARAQIAAHDKANG
jgi:hypothetical protein